MCYGAEAAWVPALVSAVAGAGTAAAGTYSAAKGQKMQIEAQDRARLLDQQKQAVLQEESDAALRSQVSKFAPEDVKKEIDLAAAMRAATAVPASSAPPPASYQSAPSSAPVEVKGDLERRLGDATTKAQDEARRLSQLKAFGDVGLGQTFQLSRLGEGLRQLRANSRGSTNVMNAQARLGDTGAQGWRNRADIANILSQVVSSYGKRRGSGTPAPDDSSYAGWSNSPY
jgi:hypothetical protein